jgi:hypothetical protein
MRLELKRLRLQNIDLERQLGLMRVKLRDLLIMKADQQEFCKFTEDVAAILNGDKGKDKEQVAQMQQIM